MVGNGSRPLQWRSRFGGCIVGVFSLPLLLEMGQRCETSAVVTCSGASGGGGGVCASRVLTDPSPARIESLVSELAMKRLVDGQFDECKLTLADLHLVEESLVGSLASMYHGRIKYPDQPQTA